MAGAERPRVLVVAPGSTSAGGMNSMIDTAMASGLGRLFALQRLSLHRDGPAPQKAWAAATGFTALAAELARRRPALVWVHATKGASIQRKSLVVLIARAAGVPVIMHLHSDRVVDYLERAPTPVLLAARRALESSRVVIVLDPAWIPRLSRIAKADYRHVPNPVDVPPEVDRSRAEAGRILQIGKLTRGKGVFTTVEAFESARAELPGASLHFVGDGPDELELLRWARDAGLADQVTHHGWVGRSEVYRLIESSQVVVLPSEAEGLPMSLLEAMARAVPVISTPVGGVRDLLADGECGVLVPVGNSPALAAGLVRVLSEPGYASEIGLRGRQRVLARYSTDLFASAMRDLMLEALTGPP